MDTEIDTLGGNLYTMSTATIKTTSRAITLGVGRLDHGQDYISILQDQFNEKCFLFSLTHRLRL